MKSEIFNIPYDFMTANFDNLLIGALVVKTSEMSSITPWTVTFSHRSDYRKTIHLLILSPLKHVEHVLRSQVSIQFCLKHIFAHKSTVIHWSSSFSVFLLGNPLKQCVKLGADPHFFPTFFLLLMDEMVSDRLCIHHFLNRVSVDDKRNFYCVNRVSQYLK